MIHWNDESNLRKSLLTVNQDIFDDTADLYFPIENSKYLEKYKWVDKWLFHWLLSYFLRKK